LQGSRFSSLTEMTPQNVANLKPVCSKQLDFGSYQSTPLIIAGVVYTTTAHMTYALDAVNCALKWQSTYTPKATEPFPVDRGLAFSGDRLVRGETDGHLVALDVATGKTLWDVAPAVASGNDPGAKSWPDATAASRGGGGMWTSYTLDPDTGEILVPVANPASDFASSARSGTNLYTDSVVVLDATPAR
jgi:alcohol dehydrogenase (cytochrome c)